MSHNRSPVFTQSNSPKTQEPNGSWSDNSSDKSKEENEDQSSSESELLFDMEEEKQSKILNKEKQPTKKINAYQKTEKKQDLEDEESQFPMDDVNDKKSDIVRNAEKDKSLAEEFSNLKINLRTSGSIEIPSPRTPKASKITEPQQSPSLPSAFPLKQKKINNFEVGTAESLYKDNWVKIWQRRNENGAFIGGEKPDQQLSSTPAPWKKS